MKALILAAGYGTRLFSIIKDTPKALIDIKGKSLLNYILEKLRGIKRLDHIYIITNDKFYDQFVSWQKTIPLAVTIINDHTKTPEGRLGSVGDIHFAIQQETIADDLIVIGSDNLFSGHLTDFIDFAQKKSPFVSIGAYDIGSLKEAKRFGTLKINKEFRITSFEEKSEQPQSTLAAMCLYYFPKTSLELLDHYLQEKKKVDSAGDYIQWLCENYKVFAFQFFGKWYDIGSVDSLKEARKEFI